MSYKIRRFLLLWLALIAVYSLLRSHTFLSAVSHDDGLFLYGGQAWADGYLPYRDAWDHKAPGILFFHSLPFRLFPFSLPAVKLHQILWLAASAAILYHVLRNYFLRTSAWPALALYVFFTGLPFTIRTGGLTEEDALCFIMLAYWIALRRSGSRLRKAFLSGLFLGIACQFRQTYIFSFIFILGAILKDLRDRSIPWRQWLPSLLWIGAGSVLPEIIVSFYFWAHGAWYDYFEASYLVNFYYVGPGRPDIASAQELWKQWEFIRNTGPYLLSPLLAAGVFRWEPSPLRWIFFALLGTYCGELFSIGLSGEYYGHYYVQASISMAFFLAFFFEGVRHRVHAWRKAKEVSPTVLLSGVWVVLLVIATVLPLIWGVQRYVSDFDSILNDRRNPEGEYAFQQSVALAAAQLTDPEDKILLIGHEPNSVYLFAKRHAGSRYYHYSPLWKEKLTGTVKDRHIHQFLSDLQTRQPTLLLLDLSKMDSSDPLDRIRQRAPEALPYVQENYIPLRDALSPEEMKEFSEPLFWYDAAMVFWVRKDQVEDIRERYEKEKS